MTMWKCAAIELCSQKKAGEGWENISLPVGPLCGFCWSLNVFHSPYFRASPGINGNQAVLYLCLICWGYRVGREKGFLSCIFLPWLCSHLLAGTACFLTEKMLVNQVHGRKKKRPPVQKFLRWHWDLAVFVCIGSPRLNYSCIGNESGTFFNLLKNWAKHRWIKDLQHARFINAGARPS